MTVTRESVAAHERGAIGTDDVPAAGAEHGTAGAVLLDYIAAHVQKIAEHEQGVRDDAPDAVHQMRVNARRARSALQAYRPLLDRGRTDPLVDGLRALGRALAPARDAEVLRERISTGLAALVPPLLVGPAKAEVARHFARTEAEARAAALATLDGEEYAMLRAGLDELLARPPLTERASRPADRELPRSVRKTARRLKKAVKAALDPDDPHRDEAVHQARKSGKRLRYATEVAKPAVGNPAKRFTKGLKGFQSALGEHQDTVVARTALRELGARAHGAGEDCFPFGVLYGEDAALARRREDELPQLWAKAWRAKNRKWFA
jgi:CHAD domain-containing protein